MSETRRVGRPPLFEGQTMRPVYTRVPEQVHDRLMSLSNQSGQSVHALVREAVNRLVDQSSVSSQKIDLI